MSTDRELLELAARAAGVRIGNWIEYADAEGFASDAKVAPWNPLTDDGDALRLLTELRLCVDWQPGLEEVHVGHTIEDFPPAQVEYEEYDDFGNRQSLYRGAATRRAIVRAAAEIGKDMK